jgi:hypothetical protein
LYSAALLAGADPQGGAIGEGVLGRAVVVLVVRQGCHADLERSLALEGRPGAGGCGQHGTFALGEMLGGFVFPTEEVQIAGLDPGGQHGHVLDFKHAVDGQGGLLAFGDHRLVVPGAHVLDQDPGRLGGGVGQALAGSHQLAEGALERLPGRGRFGVEPGLRKACLL